VTVESLEIIQNAMAEMGLEYSFMKRKSEPVYPYFTGEYQEIEPLNEDGLEESLFILNGFSRGEAMLLEEAKAKIKEKFNPRDGLIVTTESGSVVAIFYSNSLPVETEDAELERIQINLDVKEWSVN
jgi:hypothetical protein